MKENFFNRIKQTESKSDQKGPLNPVPMDPVPELRPKTWTREELEYIAGVTDKMNSEDAILRIAENIFCSVVRTNNWSNISAGCTAKWSVMSAVALIKYAKAATEDPEFWNEETDDAFFDKNDCENEEDEEDEE